MLGWFFQASKSYCHVSGHLFCSFHLGWLLPLTLSCRLNHCHFKKYIRLIGHPQIGKAKYWNPFCLLGSMVGSTILNQYISLIMVTHKTQMWHSSLQNKISKSVQFAREHGRQYNSAAEVHLRRQIFNENYQSMQEHNARWTPRPPCYIFDGQIQWRQCWA